MPKSSYSDNFGMMEYKVIGVTKKNSDKRILAICEDTNPNSIFKFIYIQIIGTKAIDCGHVYNTTKDNFDKTDIGQSYKGYRNSKWIKLNPTDFKFDGVYES